MHHDYIVDGATNADIHLPGGRGQPDAANRFFSRTGAIIYNICSYVRDYYYYYYEHITIYIT